MNPVSSLSPLDAAVVSLIRSIPEQWRVFEHDELTSTEQRTLFLLTAAGLIERRFGIHLEMAGQVSAIEASFSATGEHGLVEALDPLLAEVWTKWGKAFKDWKKGDAACTSPFRVVRTGSDAWRLTEHGVMARTDLDDQSPSDGAAAFVGCRQRTLEFVLCSGHQQDRPSVPGEGRLIQLDVRDDSTSQPAPTPQPTHVAITNAGEIAKAFGEVLMPQILEAINAGSSSGESTKDSANSEDSKSSVNQEIDEFGGPEPDPHDERVAWMLNKRIYLGRDTQLSRLFWLLTTPIGCACDLADVQRAVDGMETSAEIGSEHIEDDRDRCETHGADANHGPDEKAKEDHHCEDADEDQERKQHTQRKFDRGVQHNLAIAFGDVAADVGRSGGGHGYRVQ